MNRALKKTLRWTLRTLACLIVLVALLPVLLYIPVVQNFVKDMAVSEAEKATGWDINVERLRLRWPLRLSVEGVEVITAPADTMLTAGRLDVGVAMLPLLKGKVEVDYARLDSASYQLGTPDSLLWLKARIDRFDADAAGLTFKFDDITLPRATLDGADIRMVIRPDTTATPPDTTAPSPMLIRAGEIELRRVRFAMAMRPTIDTLECDVPLARLSKGRIDMLRHTIDAESLTVDSVAARYIFTNETAPQRPLAAADSIATAPWTIRASRLGLTARSGLYALKGAHPMPGLDMNYISVTGVAVEVDSFMNRGAEIRLPLRRLEATERCGLTLNARGVFEMDSARMYARDFEVLTNASRLWLDGSLGLGAGLSPCLRAEGSLSLNDAVLAMPSLRPMVAKMPLPRLFTINTDLCGTDEALDLRRLDVRYPGMLDLRASGRVYDLLNPARLGGDIKLRGALTGGSRLLASLTPGAVFTLPQRLTLQGTVSYRPGSVTGDIHATANDGRLALKGSWTARSEGYTARLSTEAFPVDAFMPSLGVGNVTASLSVKGHGYNPLKRGTAVDVDAEIASVTYNRRPLRNVTARVSLEQSHADGLLRSLNPDADFDVEFSALLADTMYTWELDGDIRHLDLRALGLADTVMNGALELSSTGRYNPRSGDVEGRVKVDGLDWHMPGTDLIAGSTTLGAEMTSTQLSASLTNGDLDARLRVNCPLDTLLKRLSQIEPAVRRQIAARRLNLDSLKSVLPPMTAILQAGSSNLLSEFLAPSGISFNSLGLSIDTDSLISLSGRVLGLTTGTTALDTVEISAIQHGSFLTYNAHAGNRPGTLDDFADIRLNGYLGDNRLTALLRQKNIKGETGFSLGLMLQVADSTASLRITTPNPVIAYKPWQVNRDNFVSFNFIKRRMDADLAVSNANSSIRLYTEMSRIDTTSDYRDLILKISNVHIQDWLAISPFAPPMTGDLSADMRVNWNRRDLTGEGTVRLADFYYDRQRVGSFGVDLNVRNQAQARALRADASLTVDSIRALTLTGVLNDSTSPEPVRLSVNVNRFPLSVANPFLPADYTRLEGALNGRMNLTGTMKHPSLNGYLAFDSAACMVKMLGQKFRFADTRIPVDSNVVRFNSFNITAANENPLTLDGTVALQSLTDIAMNLTLKARNMQIVNSSRPRGADVFGKAFIDADASVRGNSDFMLVNADLTVLGGTNVTYVLPGGEQSLQNMAGDNTDMVRFVNFNDSAQVAKSDTIAKTLAFILNADLKIQEGSSVTVYLSPNGQNRAQVQGQGALTYTMSPVNSGRLTGRYTIDKGYVKYTPPMLSEKYFELEQGSYVAFNGDMLDPILSIKATDHLKANVTQTGQNSRLVTFDVGLDVGGTLQNMNVAFDLSTDDDITVQNELLGMTREQRASEAMNLLLYNVYTGPGTKGSASLGGNPLFSFLESRLNSWVGNAIPGVELSFGIEQYDRTYEGSTSTTTSYSYRLSKSLFDDRFKIIVGGNYSTDANADENFSENIINDISFEYLLNRTGTMYVRLFRHTGYESILEGEVTQTGVGFVYRRKIDSLLDFFPFLRRKSPAKPARP